MLSGGTAQGDGPFLCRRSGQSIREFLRGSRRNGMVQRNLRGLINLWQATTLRRTGAQRKMLHTVPKRTETYSPVQPNPVVERNEHYATPPTVGADL